MQVAFRNSFYIVQLEASYMHCKEKYLVILPLEKKKGGNLLVNAKIKKDG